MIALADPAPGIAVPLYGFPPLELNYYVDTRIRLPHSGIVLGGYSAWRPRVVFSTRSGGEFCVAFLRRTRRGLAGIHLSLKLCLDRKISSQISPLCDFERTYEKSIVGSPESVYHSAVVDLPGVKNACPNAADSQADSDLPRLFRDGCWVVAGRCPCPGSSSSLKKKRPLAGASSLEVNGWRSLAGKGLRHDDLSTFRRHVDALEPRVSLLRESQLPWLRLSRAGQLWRRHFAGQSGPL